MGSVSFLCSPSGFPDPICSRTGDVFKEVEFVDDVPSGFVPGCVAIIHCNSQFIQKHLYVLKHATGIFMVRLTTPDNGVRYEANSRHTTFKSGVYLHSEIKILGRVVEMYPTGDPSEGWLIRQEGLMFNSAHDRKVLAPARPRR